VGAQTVRGFANLATVLRQPCPFVRIGSPIELDLEDRQPVEKKTRPERLLFACCALAAVMHPHRRPGFNATRCLLPGSGARHGGHAGAEKFVCGVCAPRPARYSRAMAILVTGSAGHLGEALVRTLRARRRDVVGIDLRASPFTARTGSIADRAFVKSAMAGIDTVLHAATLHKPHVATHSRQDFVDTNITGTLNLLEEAAAAGVKAFVFTSTTSVYGDALRPPADAPAVWVTEDLAPVPRNIYGATKAAAEDLCQLFHRNQGLPVLVLRTSRFFPEEDDDKGVRAAFTDGNLKANEFLYRRVDVEDIVEAHLNAAERAPAIGFAKYIISAATPFTPEDLAELRRDAPAVVRRRVPEYAAVYGRLGWRMAPSIDRVYVSDKARRELGWQPRYDFRRVVELVAAGGDGRSPLARAVGSKGYHDERFADGPYPVE
jgi:UDP-glucose 4-epimerase